MPRRELNDRFKAHIAKAQRVRRVVTTSLLVTCLLVGSGLAFEIIVPPHSIARATLNNNLAAVRDALPNPIAPLASIAANARDAFVSLGTSAAASISDTLAPLSTFPSHAHDQLAAVASLPWIDALANTFYDTVCPFFHSCPQTVSSPPAVAVRPQPARTNVTIATTTSATSQQQPTHVASPSQPIQQTIVQQPVIERTKETVRTIVQGGVDAGYVDARMSALQQSLAAQIAAVAAGSHSESQTIYQTLGAVAQIDNVDDIHVTNSHWTGGVISGATITGGSVTATDFAGIMGIAKGGTGTSTSPSYGQLLIGDGAGGYNLIATSSLGISSGGGSGPSFGQGFEITKGALAPTTTIGIVVSASSTFNGGVSIDRATTSNATSTNLFATLGHFTTGIIDALTSAAATITNLTATTITATTASTTVASSYDGVFIGRTATTSLYGSATSTFGAGIQTTALNVTSSTATSTFANGIQLTSGCFRMANGSCAGAGGGGGTVTSVDASGGSTGLTFSGGPITGAGTLTLAGTLAVANGGTGWAAMQSGTIPYGNGSSALATTSSGTAGQVLALLNGVPTWASTTTLANISGSLAVGSGGTGSTTLTGILKGNGTGGVQTAVAGTDYAAASSVFGKAWEIVNTTTLAPTTSVGILVNASSTFNGGISIDRSTTTNATTTNLYVSNELKIGSLSGFLKAVGGVVSAALVDLANNVTGILAVGNGGTGWSNVASGAVVLGNGSGSLATTTAGTNGQVLALVSGTPTWVATTSLSTIGGTLNVGSGGTGQTTFTSSQLLYGNATNGLSSVATSSASCSSGVSCSSFTVVGSVAPSITNTGLLSLTQNGGGSAQTGALTFGTSTATSFNGLTIANAITNSSGTFTFAPDTITGTLNVAAGGTGLSSYTAGSVLYASGATTLAGTTTANLKATLALNNVENTALSTWAGSTNLTTLGTIGTGVWNGTTIAVANGGTGWANVNAGYIPFGNGASALSTSTNLFWDSTNSRLGIGTTSPFQKFSLVGSAFISATTTTNDLVVTGGPHIDIRAYGPVGDGVADDWTAVNSATTTIGSANETLVISTPIRISKNVSFPQNIKVVFERAGRLIGNVGTEQVTFASTTPEAGLHQIFQNVVVSYSFGGTIYPEWFGAAGDGTTNDRAAIQSAIDALANRGIVKLAAKNYAINDQLNITRSYVGIEGDGQTATRLYVTGANKSGIKIGTTGSSISNPIVADLSIFQGTPSAPTSCTTACFGISASSTAIAKIHDIQVDGFLTGISLRGAGNTLITNTEASYEGSTNNFVGYDFDGSGNVGGSPSSVCTNCWVSAAGSSGTGSIGFNLHGAYVSDLIFNSPSTASSNYGFNIDYSSATPDNSADEDVEIYNPVIDQFTLQGILVNGSSNESMLTIDGGWINPKPTGAETDAVYVTSARGVSVHGVQFYADANYAHAYGLKALNSSNITATGNQFVSQLYGVHFNNVTDSSVTSNRFYNIASKAATNDVSVFGGKDVIVSTNSFDGTASIGAYFDSATRGSSAIGNIASSTVTTATLDQSSGGVSLLSTVNGMFGLGTTSPSAMLTVQASGGNIARFLRTQSTNDSGGYIELYGGAGATLRGILGFTKTGSGADTLFSGELADAVGLRSQGALQFGTNGASARMTIDTSGNVGIGTASPGNTLDLQNATTTGQLRLGDGTNWFSIGRDNISTGDYKVYKNFTLLQTIGANGNVTFNGTGGTCTINGSGACTSDARLKTNVAPIAGDDALSKLSLINGITYNWIDPALDQSQRVGVIAQDVQKAFPQLVGSASSTFMGQEGRYLTVDYGGLTAPLISAVNELSLRLGLLAATSASSTPSSRSFATSFFSNLFAHIIAWLGDAQNGIVDLFAKNIYAENAHFNNVAIAGTLTASSTLTDQLCVKKSNGTPVCVTGDELSSLLSGSSGSVLGAHTESAAGAPGGNSGLSLGAPAAVPAREATPNADTGTTTTSSVADPVNDNAPAASSTPAANDNPQPQGAEQSSHDGNQPAATSTQDVVAPAVQPANDNPPPLGATGTDATTSTTSAAQ